MGGSDSIRHPSQQLHRAGGSGRNFASPAGRRRVECADEELYDPAVEGSGSAEEIGVNNLSFEDIGPEEVSPLSNWC